MPDRFEFAAVRQKIIDAVRTDLMGPVSETEVLDENPKLVKMMTTSRSLSHIFSFLRQ